MNKLKKIIGKISEAVLNIFLVIAIILAIIAISYSFQTKVLKKKYANILGYTAFEVVTGSMSNTINVGDIVLVKITQNVSENDIIVYESEDEIITHRLIKIEDNTFITKGDANNQEDEPICQEQTIGKVIKIMSGITILRKVLFTPEVMSLIIISMSLMGIAMSLGDKEENGEN